MAAENNVKESMASVRLTTDCDTERLAGSQWSTTVIARASKNTKHKSTVLGVARANTAVGVSPETFLLQLLQQQA
jgi:hypothetical protein